MVTGIHLFLKCENSGLLNENFENSPGVGFLLLPNRSVRLFVFSTNPALMPHPHENDFPDSQSITDQAFHGTSRENAALILAEKFMPSQGDNEYLGPGVYFFERQPSEATLWAKHRYPKSWAVLQSVVRYGRCLNLDDRKHSDILTRIVSGLRTRRSQRITESDAIKILSQAVQIDTVIGVLRKEQTIPPWNDARFGMGNKIMLCVRNLSNVQHTQLYCTGP